MIINIITIILVIIVLIIYIFNIFSIDLWTCVAALALIAIGNCGSRNNSKCDYYHNHTYENGGTTDHKDPDSEIVVDEDIEKYIEVHSDELKNMNNYIVGPINIFQTSDENVKALQVRLEKYYNQGKIVFRGGDKAHKKMKSPGWDHYGDGSHSMDRAFASDYINNLFDKGLTQFRAPRWYIVVDDPEIIKYDLSVNIRDTTIYLLNAVIRFEKIIGVPVATKYATELYTELRFGDSHEGRGNENLIQTDDGKLYIIDLEQKGFTYHGTDKYYQYFDTTEENLKFISDNIDYLGKRLIHPFSVVGEIKLW
jgi:hypothetical protein